MSVKITMDFIVYQGEPDVRPPSRESSDEEREEKEPWPDDHSSSRYITWPTRSLTNLYEVYLTSNTSFVEFFIFVRKL